MPDEREAWNNKYAEGSHASLVPDRFFLEAYDAFVAPKFPDPSSKAALDVAGGVGRHSIYLAKLGWNVDLIDISELGISLAKQNAVAAKVQITGQITDLRFYELGAERYDLILVFFYLQRELFPSLIRGLKKGGLLIYKTYTQETVRLGKGPSHTMYLLEPDELRQTFSALHVLHYEESPEKGVAELVAQK